MKATPKKPGPVSKAALGEPTIRMDKPKAPKKVAAPTINAAVKKAFQEFMSGRNFMTAYRIWRGLPDKPLYVKPSEQEPLKAMFMQLAAVQSWKQLKNQRAGKRRGAAKQTAKRKVQVKAATKAPESGKEGHTRDRAA